MGPAGTPYVFRPPAAAPWHVPRPELMARLAGARAHGTRAVLLWGPPGLGKSQAAADALRQAGAPGLWIHLAPFGLDPALFLSTMLAGLKQTFPAFDPSWAPLLESTAARASSSAVTGNMHEALAELAPEGFILALDLALTPVGPGLAGLLGLLLETLPPGSQLLLVSDAPGVAELLPTPEQWLVLGPEALAPSPAERARLAPVPRAPRDWLDWALQRWAEETGQAPDAELTEPWARALPLAAALPWVDPALWQAVVEPAAPWPAAGPWPPLLVKLEGDAPLWLPHPGAGSIAPLAEPTRKDLERRLGVYLAATSPLQAATAFLRAGDAVQAEALAAPAGEALLASYHYQALAELLGLFPAEHAESSPRLACLLADLKRVTGGLDEALALYETAEREARARADHRWAGRALAGQSAVWGMRGDERFYKLAMAARELLPAEDLPGRAAVYNLLGIYHLQANESALALTYLEEALRLYTAANDHMGRGKALINLGLCHSKSGKFERARATYQQAIACADASLKLPSPMVYNNLARIHLFTGALKSAWDAAERALVLARQLGAAREAAHAEWTLGEINAQRGDWAKATLYFEASLESARDNGDAIAQANAVASQAEVAMRQGAWAKARLLLDRAIALRALPLTDPAAYSLAEVAAKLHLALGELEQAESMLEPIAHYTERHGFRYFQTTVEFALARLHQARGDQARAQALFAGAAQRCDELGYTHLKALEHRHYQERTLVVPAASEEVTPDLQVSCFGHLDVRVEGESREEVFSRSKKAQQLLLFLLLNRKGLSRDELGDMFDHQSSASLMLVSRLRQALEPSLGKGRPSRFILLQDGRYTFNFGLRYALDAEEFRFLCQQAQDPLWQSEDRLAALSKALELYRGPFLPHCDDAWVTIERERFRLMANGCFAQLFEAFGRRADHGTVLRLAEQAIRLDFLNEEAHRAKLMALAHQGRREEALKHYKKTDAHLAKRFGLRPGEELTATFQQIMRGQVGRA